jgi:hypothetical protein
MVQYPRPYGFTHLYASRSEDLTVTSLTQTCLNPAHTSTPRGTYIPCCCKQSHSHLVMPGTQLRLSEPIPNDSIAVVSYPQPYDYESDVT